MRDLAAVRGAAEIAINRRVHLTLGLKAYVSVNPDIDEREFAEFSALIMKEADGILSVTSIKDNVINDVYPREGNEGAIGLELLKNPDQRVAAEYAIETGRPWLAGPIKLVQGGEAFINRAPVYVTEAGAQPGDGRYWGMVSILVDKQTLSDEILKAVPENLTIAIRGRTDRSEPGQIFTWRFRDRIVIADHGRDLASNRQVTTLWSSEGGLAHDVASLGQYLGHRRAAVALRQHTRLFSRTFAAGIPRVLSST